MPWISTLLCLHVHRETEQVLLLLFTGFSHALKSRYLSKVLTKPVLFVWNSFPCLLCLMCLKDTFTFEEKMLRDPRRLYAPGRLYHIVERKSLR